MNSIKHTYKNKHTYKKSKYLYPRLQFLIIMSVIVVMLCSVFVSIKAKGSDTTSCKYFTTIQIEEGDSLWSIAHTYCTSDYSDYKEYISEVKSINNMDDDNVKKGSYLVIPYYK